MRRFGLLVVALLAVLGGVLGWAVVVGPGAMLPASTSTTPALSHASAPPSPPSGHPAPPNSSPTPTPLPSSNSPAAPSPTAQVAVVPTVDSGLLTQVNTAAAPTRVSIATLGVDVAVVAVGLDSAGAMALPPDPDTAGWYQFGPAPSSPAGATVIAAHVDSLVYGLGPFAALADAPMGTEIVVTDSVGQERSYAVTAHTTVIKGDVVWPTIFDRAGPPRLIVVTCGGEFDYSTRHYLSNVIVEATPVG